MLKRLLQINTNIKLRCDAKKTLTNHYFCATMKIHGKSKQTSYPAIAV